MEIMLQEQTGQTLYQELDKGIDDMEQGHIISHEESMQMLREQIGFYDIQGI